MSSSHNIFTVDLEEWFHICGAGGELAPDRWDRLPTRAVETTRRLLDLLARTGVPATFFVLGWVADRHPALIDEILAAGHDIGSHGYWHERAFDLGPIRFRQDLRDSVRAIARCGVPRVTAFRAPEWSINERSLWALSILAEEGFEVDASMAPLRIVGHPGYPRGVHLRPTHHGPITELPPLVADRFGQVMPMGWGWGLRMSAPQRVLQSIDAANRAGRSAVLMVHPWELDDDPPVVRLPRRLRFAHYFRLSGFGQRLNEVLRLGTFTRMRDALPPGGPAGTGLRALTS